VFSKEKTELFEAIVLELKNYQLTMASVYIQKCHQLWKFTGKEKLITSHLLMQFIYLFASLLWS
jgi:hypothetical protein